MVAIAVKLLTKDRIENKESSKEQLLSSTPLRPGALLALHLIS